MTTELSDGRTVPGTNRNEILLKSLLSASEIRYRGEMSLVQTEEDNHARNVKARKANKARKLAALKPKRSHKKKVVV